MAGSFRLLGTLALATAGCGTLMGLDVDSLSTTPAAGNGGQSNVGGAGGPNESGRGGGGGLATSGSSATAGKGNEAGAMTAGGTRAGGDGGSSEGGTEGLPTTGDGGAGGVTDVTCNDPWLTGEVDARDLTTNYADPPPSATNWANTAPHSGTYSLQADLSWAADDYGATVGFGYGNNPVSTTQFSAIAFWIRSGGKPLPNLNVILRDAGGPSNFVSVIGPYVATVDSTWRRVVVPLSAFQNVDRSKVNNITLQIDQEPNTAGSAQVFVDDGVWIPDSCP